LELWKAEKLLKIIELVTVVDVTGSSKYLLPLLTILLPIDRLYLPVDFPYM
jgi:hypothetical protein